jgi:ribose transport system ATP-binding protein
MIDDDHASPLLEVRGITKAFAGVQALKGVNLTVRAGEVHCVLGQNGAGKSTLIKTLAGVHQPDSGEILWQGEPVTIADPTAALGLGIATMYQELDVVDGLTITENIFLGHEHSTGGLLKVAHANRLTKELLTRLGHGEIPPSTEVGELSAATKQIVSMARALSRDTKLIIMDEPSAVLDSGEVANLFRVIRELTNQNIAVVYISHRLEEIRQIGDRISVIKDGRSTASGLAVTDTPTAELIRLMTGRDVVNEFPAAVPVPDNAPVVLEVKQLNLRGHFSDVNFAVRAGEIVGLAGLVGSGRSEILETIYGARKATSGTISVHGKTLRPGSVNAAVRADMGFSPEERKSQGLILDEPIYKNVTLSTFGRFARGGILNEGAEKDGPHSFRRQPAENSSGPLARARHTSSTSRRTNTWR